MISRAQEPEQLYAKGGIASIRQPYFLGRAVKKIGKGLKKVVKSPLGKAALIGGLGYFAPKAFGTTWGGDAGWGSKLKGLFGEGRLLGNLLHTGKGADRKLSLGKMGLLGLLGAGTALPFMADEEEVVEETPWEETPASISNIYQMARDRHPSLMYLPKSDYVQSGFFTGAKDGGRVGIANGGNAAQAQAEQMLRMEYQKYRNQGGTMSYQQFKMAVLKQAQQQGPMASAQPQMMNKGGRIGYKDGTKKRTGIMKMLAELEGRVPEFATYGSMLAGLGIPFLNKGGRVGYRLGEMVEDQESMVMTPQGDEVVTDQMEEIEGDTAGPSWWWKRIETLEYLGYSSEDAARIAANDNLYFEIVGDLSKLEGPILPSSEDPVNPFTPRPIGPVLPDREMAASGGRVGLLGGGSVPGTKVAGYTTPAGYNRFDYPTGGVRVGAANGGIMPLLDLKGKEKDYRQDGGFVGIGRKEKADDVPARLSKNEFVFTADAVRNAGGGDIDKGAEVMHNMMDHLEQGGQISEESQGLGAQGMYDNMRMLETRVA